MEEAVGETQEKEAMEKVEFKLRLICQNLTKEPGSRISNIIIVLV
jgi:hypothetical protein